jgi:porin
MQFLGLDGGALSIIGTAFSYKGAFPTNLFWTQRVADGSWTLQFGQNDVTDFVDIYGAVSPNSPFQNPAFSTNPTIHTPNPCLGVSGGARLVGSKQMATLLPGQSIQRNSRSL